MHKIRRITPLFFKSQSSNYQSAKRSWAQIHPNLSSHVFRRNMTPQPDAVKSVLNYKNFINTLRHLSKDQDSLGGQHKAFIPNAQNLSGCTSNFEPERVQIKRTSGFQLFRLCIEVRNMSKTNVRGLTNTHRKIT